jgi:predicted 3-demethylubiquinone-9 3-methyltransferase (glyoxalase superfamily)
MLGTKLEKAGESAREPRKQSDLDKKCGIAIRRSFIDPRKTSPFISDSGSVPGRVTAIYNPVMKKITPYLWFDKEAKEAAEFYVSLFPGSKIGSVKTLHNTPSGDTDIVSFTLAGQPFTALSAGPLFKFNPSVSFHVKFKTKEEVDEAWKKLSDGGKIRIPLGRYPFSERYGWAEDRYGLSWQLAFSAGSEIKQKITPVLMFAGKVCGKAEEAVNFYASVFKDSSGRILARYGQGDEPDNEGTVRYASFTLLGEEFGAMDSAREHSFVFNEAISFMAPCDTQEEIDSCWEKLSADSKAEQCGWLKDKYGLSWQITPTVLNEMMGSKDEKQVARVTQAFLKMNKFDIAKLKEAYEGK